MKADSFFVVVLAFERRNAAIPMSTSVMIFSKDTIWNEWSFIFFVNLLPPNKANDHSIVWETGHSIDLISCCKAVVKGKYRLVDLAAELIPIPSAVHPSMSSARL